MTGKCSEEEALPIYRRVTLSRVLRISALMLILFGLICLVSLAVGAVFIAPGDVIEALRHALTGNGFASEEGLILFSVRLPRIFFAGIVGASLSLGGVVFQALLRNPLADPYVLGISGGSALGAIVGIVLGAGSFYPGCVVSGFWRRADYGFAGVHCGGRFPGDDAG